MYIAHSNIEETNNLTLIIPKKTDKRKDRVSLWMRRNYQKDYDSEIKLRENDIKEIQEHIPGWMPTKPF